MAKKEEAAAKSIVDSIEELLEKQQSALRQAVNLLEVKDHLIEILEDEIRLRKKQNLVLSIILITLAVVITGALGLSCIL